jgi:regulator of extracellular matrix RemA (YlzA/DUF370 family)
MAPTELFHIGFGNMVAAGRVLAIVAPDSLPVRRLLREARERGTLVDASRGRKVKSAIVMDNGYVITSALHPQTIARRLRSGEFPGRRQDE